MKRDQLKGFIAGITLSAVIVTGAGSAYAAYTKTATLNYSNIKITMDGKQITPKDVNGTTVEPFAINGTTYLPVRAVANALGLYVAWDQATSTVILSTENSSDSELSTTKGTVLMDKNGIKITYMGIEKETDSPLRYDIKLKIENTTSTNYTVQIRDLSVNNIMANDIFSCDVVAGKTDNDEIWLYNLKESGVQEPIENIEFKFHIFNSDTFSGGFDSDIIKIN